MGEVKEDGIENDHVENSSKYPRPTADKMQSTPQDKRLSRHHALPSYVDSRSNCVGVQIRGPSLQKDEDLED